MIVASRNISAGHTITETDFTIFYIPEDYIPGGASRTGVEVVGKTTHTPILIGEYFRWERWTP